MAPKDKQRKTAEASHSAGTWSVRLKTGWTERVTDAYMRRNADQSYTFTRGGRIVLDVPPGEASCVRRHAEPQDGAKYLMLPESMISVWSAAHRDLQDAIRDQGICPGVVVLPYGVSEPPEPAPAGSETAAGDPGPIETDRAK